MSSTAYHIAQVNIARMLAPLDDPQLAGFVSLLAEINALADLAPGFVWRLQTENGDATSLRPYADDRILFNLSVWESPEAWHAFVFRGDHVRIMRRRLSWFERPQGAYSAMWWVPAGHIPGIEEAKARLEFLRAHGESAHAFSYARRFPPPESA